VVELIRNYSFKNSTGRGDKSKEDRIDGEGKAVPEDVRVSGLMEFVDILFEYIG